MAIVQVKDKTAYQKVTEAFKKQRKGVTVADIVATTALPLHKVRELVPVAADEYSARLEVTESGEILYSFPQGFTSKYRGFRAGLRRFTDKFMHITKMVGKGVFKGWIMVMLVGYFVLFMLIALVALLVSVAASMSNSERSDDHGGGIGGLFIASSIFDIIIRIWFYSELTKAFDRQRYDDAPRRPKGRPLYKAIFSFVFGDEDPNANWSDKEKQSVIAYLHANKGVISLPELMTLTGLSYQEAESAITSYCAEFGGMPEATEDGTVVYRFDELLLRADKQDRSFGSSALIKRLKIFSQNDKKMNIWFSIINGVNLIFGSYFLFNVLSTGAITTQAQFNTASWLYKITYLLSAMVIDKPLPVITIGLGFIPLIFSVLFWIIPALRFYLIKQDNEHIKFENLRKFGYGRIWSFPKAVKSEEIKVEAAEFSPQHLAAAQDKVIKDMNAYSVADVNLENEGVPIYSFPELEREKAALEKYRAAIKTDASALGKTVFDSGN